MTKKDLELGGIVNTAATPKEAGIPHRGTNHRKVKAERRSDQMFVRMKSITRALIKILGDAEGVFISEIIERVAPAYAKNA